MFYWEGITTAVRGLSWRLKNGKGFSKSSIPTKTAERDVTFHLQFIFQFLFPPIFLNILELKEMVKWQEIFWFSFTNQGERQRDGSTFYNLPGIDVDYPRTYSTISNQNFWKMNCSINLHSNQNDFLIFG